jgi:hypothetical protein
MTMVEIETPSRVRRLGQRQSGLLALGSREC